MANDISHVVAGGYFALPFNVDSSITYSETNPTQFVGKAVTVNANRTVGLTATDGRVDGVIKKVEPADGAGVKATVQMRGALVFVNADATPAVTGFGGGVVGGVAAGEVKDGGVDTDARGVVTSVEGGKVVVIF
jgi:hypothetical protein